MIARISLVAVLSLLVTSISFAHDSDRIDQLEIEVQILKQQVSELQSMLHGNNKEKFVSKGDGWKSLANWRKLTTGMDETAVRRILGEPQRIRGGIVAFWYYQNGGTVNFMGGLLQGWSEPE